MSEKSLQERYEELRTDNAILRSQIEELSEARRTLEVQLADARKHRSHSDKTAAESDQELKTVTKQLQAAETNANLSLATAKRADELRYAWHRKPWTSAEVVEARDLLFAALMEQYGPVPAIQRLGTPGVRRERKRRILDMILDEEAILA